MDKLILRPKLGQHVIGIAVLKPVFSWSQEPFVVRRRFEPEKHIRVYLIAVSLKQTVYALPQDLFWKIGKD